jgi:hypothetical protein
MSLTQDAVEYRSDATLSVATAATPSIAMPAAEETNR